MDITLYLGDCLVEMDKIESCSVDMILADLPYGTTQCRWDSPILLIPLWEQYMRIIKPHGPIVLFGSQPFTAMLISSNTKYFRYCWVWEKSVPTGYLDANRRPLKAHEDICVFSLKRPAYYPQMTPTKRRVIKRTSAAKHYARDTNRITTDNKGKSYPRSVLYFPIVSSSKRRHPAQKPMPLLEYLIRTYTQPGEVVLDNVMGSGSAGVAATKSGRKFIGIEIDKKYFYEAEEWINEAAQQPPLL